VTRTLLIMVKAPVAGQVKTRLADGIGVAAATGFYRTILSRTVRRLGGDPRWRTLLGVTPDRAVWSPVWPPCDGLVAQGPGDLGARMGRLFDRLQPGPVVIIGSDIPDIEAGDIAQAFRALGGHDAVLGPAPDGGYWLIGLKRAPRIPKPFSAVRWSSEHTLADTLANLRDCRVAQLRQLSDVDNSDDHLQWRRRAHAR
jgi:hypothetical protein